MPYYDLVVVGKGEGCEIGLGNEGTTRRVKKPKKKKKGGLAGLFNKMTKKDERSGSEEEEEDEEERAEKDKEEEVVTVKGLGGDIVDDEINTKKGSYALVVGLGTGVWAIHKSVQDQLLVEICRDIIEVYCFLFFAYHVFLHCCFLSCCLPFRV